MYLWWFSIRLQLTLGLQRVMKWGLKRPIVYLAISVIKTVVAAPKPKMPTWSTKKIITKIFTCALIYIWTHNDLHAWILPYSFCITSFQAWSLFEYNAILLETVNWSKRWFWNDSFGLDTNQGAFSKLCFEQK